MTKLITMDREEAKKWAEIYTALAEGKTIQEEYNDGSWRDIMDYSCLYGTPSNYRIKPTPKTRRMTNQELADWLRDCPHEHREVKSNSFLVYQDYCYDESQANNECLGTTLIRRNHGEWEEPYIEIEE